MKIVQYLLLFPTRFRSDFCDSLFDKQEMKQQKKVNQ